MNLLKTVADIAVTAVGQNTQRAKLERAIVKTNKELADVKMAIQKINSQQSLFKRIFQPDQVKNNPMLKKFYMEEIELTKKKINLQTKLFHTYELSSQAVKNRLLADWHWENPSQETLHETTEDDWDIF